MDEPSSRDLDFARILKLKASLDRIARHRVKAHTDRSRQLAELELSQSAEHGVLLNAGLNPYEVFLRREVEQNLDAQRRNAMAITQLRLGKSILRQKQRAELDNRLLKEEFRAERMTEDHNERKSGAADKKRFAKFIKKNTTNHVEVIDPTGKLFRIDPSKVVIPRKREISIKKGVVS